MITDGDDAPTFSVPAVVDGASQTLSLTEYLGDDIVVLAFYPGDFNPACSDEGAGLDELDVFGMQEDVSVLAISGDSVFSHRAFAAEYDLHIPLLADVRGDVAADYGVTAEDGEGYHTNRAIVVVDPEGTVQYTWQTTDLQQFPPVEAVREAVDDSGGAGTAAARYRVGHAHYVEGLRGFTTATNGLEQREWLPAQRDFSRAGSELETAESEFHSAVRFGEHDGTVTRFELAEEKAKKLCQAAGWLADAARAYASGDSGDGDALRADAEQLLESASELADPPAPDDLSGLETPSVDDPAFAPADGEGSVAEVDGRIGDDELAEITAALERQSGEAATGPQSGHEGGEADSADVKTVDSDLDEGEIELELADPTAGDDEKTDDGEEDQQEDDPDDAADETLGEGDHGVPDSL